MPSRITSLPAACAERASERPLTAAPAQAVVPTNCRHSLAQAVDIFAASDPEVQDRARRIAAEVSAEGQAIALERALELAQQEQEAQAASVAYQLRKRDPFAARWHHPGWPPASHPPCPSPAPAACT